MSRASQILSTINESLYIVGNTVRWSLSDTQVAVIESVDNGVALLRYSINEDQHTSEVSVYDLTKSSLVSEDANQFKKLIEVESDLILDDWKKKIKTKYPTAVFDNFSLALMKKDPHVAIGAWVDDKCVGAYSLKPKDGGFVAIEHISQ